MNFSGSQFVFCGNAYTALLLVVMLTNALFIAVLHVSPALARSASQATACLRTRVGWVPLPRATVRAWCQLLRGTAARKRGPQEHRLFTYVLRRIQQDLPHDADGKCLGGFGFVDGHAAGIDVTFVGADLYVADPRFKSQNDYAEFFNP